MVTVGAFGHSAHPRVGGCIAAGRHRGCNRRIQGRSRSLSGLSRFRLRCRRRGAFTLLGLFGWGLGVGLRYGRRTRIHTVVRRRRASCCTAGIRLLLALPCRLLLPLLFLGIIRFDLAKDLFAGRGPPAALLLDVSRRPAEVSGLY